MSYAELHAKTNFTFLEGASHPEELVRRAVELGYTALAITDRNSLAGVVRAHAAAKDIGLKLLIGSEITPIDAPPVVLLAPDRAAYGRLSRLITQGRRAADKGECRLTLEDVAARAEGLLALCIAPRAKALPGNALPRGSASSGAGAGHCREGRGASQASGSQAEPGNQETLVYREVFPDRCYLLAELHHGPDDRRELERLLDLSRRTGIPLVAAGDVHYHVPERGELFDVLTAIRHKATVDAVRQRLFANVERHLRPPVAIAALFAESPEAVARTLEVADRCTFSLDELRYEYPEELAPPGMTPLEHLTRLAWEGARERYSRRQAGKRDLQGRQAGKPDLQGCQAGKPDLQGDIPEKVRRLLEHELQLIGELHYEAYFLTVWDLVRFARDRGILCQGRGSAANSAVCYCLGITSVDPERMDLLFERFISRERNEAPDIDVDFEHERREEVIQYLYEKYGRERAGMTAEVITYRPRSAVRDVGKALGLSLDRVDALAKRIEHFHDEPELPERCREAGIDPDSTVGRQLIGAVGQLVGFPRHLSQHTGGMVMTRGPLCELVPIENAAMPDRTVIQWNKDDLDELGILKVDCLALGMLTAIRKCFDLVGGQREHGEKGTVPPDEGGQSPSPPFPRLTLASIPGEDEDVYAMIRRADTMGVFQIESRAQMSMLPRLQPRCFYDLVIEVAIVRPGPIQGNMVHPYLRRRNGEEAATYPNDAVRRVLEKTLGVPLFQEQAMRLAVVAAGFTPGEADQLRRAMGAWRRPGVIDEFRRKLIDGMRSGGFSPEYADAIFRQIRGFGDYGFPESHAASFALLVYVSCWLKYHYPAAFTAALLNSQPMGFYAPAQLVRNARDHSIEVRPADVNYSQWDCTLEGLEGGAPLASGSQAEPGNQDGVAVRLGFRMLRGFSRSHAETIVGARGDRLFASLEDLARRTDLSRAVLARLAKAGAFESVQLRRREALWDALGQNPKELPLFDAIEKGNDERAGQGPPAPEAPPPNLPAMSAAEEVLADYRTAGLSLRAHPIAFLRPRLDAMGVVPARRLKDWPADRPVAVAGIVLVRQRPGTAKGITFVTLEDETGTANLIIRPDVWRRFRRAALGATVLVARGRLQRQGEVIHVLVTRLENLSDRLAALGPQSRDFQ